MVATLHAKGEIVHTFKLKKDKIATIQYNNRNHHAELTFRWTLFTSKQLVLFVKNDNFPTQHILERRLRLNSAKVDIFKEPFSNFKDDRVYFLIVFSDFDQKEKVATFDIYLKDDANTLKVKFIKPKE
jgi:hypothetical protein